MWPSGQMTGLKRHAPTPSHPNSRLTWGWQLAVQSPSEAPAGTGAQTPALPAMLQAEQVPQLDVEQQTPSTQWPVV